MIGSDGKTTQNTPQPRKESKERAKCVHPGCDKTASEFHCLCWGHWQMYFNEYVEMRAAEDDMQFVTEDGEPKLAPVRIVTPAEWGKNGGGIVR